MRRRILDWRDAMNRDTTAHPARAAAIAAGAGYLVGGGLFSGLTARVAATALRLGLRVALVPSVTRSLLKLGGSLFSRDEHKDQGDKSITDDAKSELKGSAPGTTHKRHHDTHKEPHS
jgi:hypothetical protein